MDESSTPDPEPPQAPPKEATRDWEQRYRTGDTPWDTGRRSSELARVLAEEQIPRGRAIDLGCGTGVNAIYLAQQGFDVTGVDLSAAALERARARAAETGVEVEWVQGDVTGLPAADVPYDLVFDRGCYHCVRRIDVAAYVAMLQRITRPGTRFVLLTGNAKEASEHGPPVVHEHQLRDELGELFDFVWIREFRFDSRPDEEGPGPLGWSCFLQRKSEDASG